MISRCFHALMRYSIVLSAFFLLYACDLAPQQPKEVKEVRKIHPKPVVKTAYGLDTYVKQLTLAQLALDTAPGNTNQLKPHLAVISEFTADKYPSPTFQPVIAISYRVKGKKDIHWAVAPFVLAIDSSDFSDLAEVITPMDNKNITVVDVHPFILNGKPAEKLALSAGTSVETHRRISQELNALLFNKTSLTELDEARIQIDLLRFFLQHHIRDAAYLAAENAGQSLAAAEDNPVNLEKTRPMSAQLDLLNSRLHREMPFTLNAL